MKIRKTMMALGALTSMTAGIAAAQTPLTYNVNGASVTLYGDVDQYLNYMHSSSGKTLKTIQDGALLRSRLGLRGEKDVGDGYKVKFVLEQGLNDTNGAQADSTRLFDRQAWVGLVTNAGEFRAGRQNGIIFFKGSYIDNTERTLGSVVNAFGTPSRFDSDLAYISPRMAGFQFEGHYSFQGSSTAGATEQGVYQLGLEYLGGPFRVGYADIHGKPPTGAVVSNKVFYENLYANYDYGKGKVYLVYIRSNNNSTTGSGTGLLFNGGSPLGNVGNLVTGTDTGALTTYGISQASVDYKVTKDWTIGALYGQIKDKSGTDKNASGWNLASYYEIFKDTKIVFLINSLDNDPKAGFRPAGSAGLTKPFTLAADVNGQTIRGVQLGFVYKF